MKKGDKIISIDGKKITEDDDIYQVLEEKGYEARGAHPVYGKQICLGVLRKSHLDRSKRKFWIYVI